MFLRFGQLFELVRQKLDNAESTISHRRSMKLTQDVEIDLTASVLDFSAKLGSDLGSVLWQYWTSTAV